MSQLIDIGDIISKLGKFLLDLLLFIPRKIFELLCAGLLAVLQAIPVPEWVSQAASSIGSLSGDVLFWLTLVSAPQGVGIVISAYLLRFVLRRIPFIG